MRVIAGALKGRRLKSPTWDGLRPTSDKLRETLFNILAPRMAGARVLDGYAGTGALGIEALSRGAARVTLRRQRSARAGADRRQPRALRRRRTAMLSSAQPWRGALDDLGARVRRRAVRHHPARSAVRRAAGRRRSLAAAGDVLAPDGVLVLEHARRRAAPETRGAARPRRVR